MNPRLKLNIHGHTGSSIVQKERSGVKAIITGCAVISEMLTGGLFLENVKMEKQRTSERYPAIASRILRQGISGFWAGFWPWGFTLGITKGMVLGGSRAFFLNRFLDAGMSKGTADITSGFLAGGCQGVVMGPVLLGRTRVNQHMAERIAQEGGVLSRGLFGEMFISMNILNTALKEEGIRTFLIGMPTMVLKRSLDWGSRFLMMRLLRGWYQEHKNDPTKKLTDIEELCCTFIGSGSSVFFLQPLDRMMPIIQAARANTSETVLSVMKQRMAKEGIFMTMQSGILVRMIHVGWHTTFAIFISHKIYESFGF